MITHQPVEIMWISCNPIPHRCVPFTRTHNIANRTESPSHGEFHHKNQLVQYSTLHEKNVCRSPQVRLGEAYLRLGELLPLGEAESIFKMALGSPKRTYLPLGEAEPTIVGQLKNIKSILSLITLFYMKNIHINNTYQMDLLQKIYKKIITKPQSCFLHSRSPR